MLRNYFKTALRNLAKNKMLSLVNIAGLATGLACVILIVLFVKDEWSFDKFHANGKNIYRLVQTTTDTAGKEWRSGNTGLPHGPVFAAGIPEIEKFCRIKGWGMTVKKGNEGIESQVLFADTSVFSVFSFDIVAGNAADMLKGRNSLVLTEAEAHRFFGNENPVGKDIEIEMEQGFETFAVTGVVKAMPLNSSLQFDMLIPFERQNPTDAAELNSQMGNWHSLYLNTFFVLKNGTDAKTVEKKLWKVYLENDATAWNEYQMENKGAKRQYLLQPLLSIHLDKDFYASNGLSNWSDATNSYILTGLAVLVLMIACINFINIAVARSLQRGKEIGVRKVSGSSKKQVMLQFLTESFVVTAIAFFVALLLVQLALPFFNSLSNKQFSFLNLIQPGTTAVFAGLIILVSLLAGFYPAFIASGFRPAQTLYSRIKLTGKNYFGKSLVVLQFTIAITLVIGTIIFTLQFRYINMANLGYDTKDMIHLQFPWDKPAELKQLKNELLKNPAIISVGTKSGDRNATLFEINGRKTDWTYYEHIDDDLLQTLRIPLTAGRYLSYRNAADTVSNCLVNEAFAEAYLDKTRPAVGQVINGNSAQPVTVAGVVKNYHSTDFREKIAPILFTLDKSGDLLNTYIKYQRGKEKDAATAIEKAYRSVLPYATLEYYYMQDWLMQRYETDTQWKKVVSFSAFIAIFIAVSGLFALTTLSVQQRVKEIGIRKVLGASVANIGFLISKDFLLLVCLAVLIASPVAYWLMNRWLQDFAYRINISWWVFVLAFIVAVCIALATVSVQAIKAALVKPVKSLRTE